MSETCKDCEAITHITSVSVNADNQFTLTAKGVNLCKRHSLNGELAQALRWELQREHGIDCACVKCKFADDALASYGRTLPWTGK